MSRTQGPLTSGPCFFRLLLQYGVELCRKTGKFSIITNCGIEGYARQVWNISHILKDDIHTVLFQQGIQEDLHDG